MTEFIATKCQIMLKGYWKVVVRPIKFQKERNPDLGSLKHTFEKCQISLQGWNYPHFHEKGQSYGGTTLGEDYIESITNFDPHIELWRMYQSGLFIHMFACPEDSWHNTKRSNVLSILYTIYRITEIYKFISNLAINDIFGNNLDIALEMNSMQNRMLVFLDPRRELDGSYQCRARQLRYSHRSSKFDIIAKANELAVQRCNWIFQRFEWLSNNVIDLIKGEQESFLKGNLKT